MDTSLEAEGEYLSLKDLKIEIDCEDGAFTLCFWVFLTSPISFPFTILQKSFSGDVENSPFLALDEKRMLTLSPLPFRIKESQNPGDCKLKEGSYVSASKAFPIGEWVHVGCEVTADIIRLYYGGDIVGEKSLNFSFEFSDSSEKISLSAPDEDGGISKCYIHQIQVLPLPLSIKDHLIRDPPQQLLVDPSSFSEVEEEVDDKVVASLVYADNRTSVKQPEAPLLTSNDEINFIPSDITSKLVNGRASFKLKISDQLSPECDNRLFLIRFDIPAMREYPFLVAFSSPVRCNGMGSPLIHKRPDIAHNIGVHEAKSSPSSKRVKLGQVNSFSTYKPGLTSDQADECNSHACIPEEIDCTYENGVEQRIKEKNEESGKSTSDSTSSSAISDLVIYKYCLGNSSERALMLKEIATLASQRQLVDLAHQVSMHLECSHHGPQIMMAKSLVEEGTKAWDLMAQSKPHVKWMTVEAEIKMQFMKISRSYRSLTHQDMQILRRIGGCQCNEDVGRENFEKIWCWLYPVALMISRDYANGLWKSLIEGLITKEEAEGSLQGPWGVEEPGTFVLRFPTSRSWPHPDAGNLVITYVGIDHSIHHRLLSLDLISYREMQGSVRSIEELLLQEPEISRLGRIIRSAQ